MRKEIAVHAAEVAVDVLVLDDLLDLIDGG
jgi:hypothetical protein